MHIRYWLWKNDGVKRRKGERYFSCTYCSDDYFGIKGENCHKRRSIRKLSDENIKSKQFNNLLRTKQYGFIYWPQNSSTCSLTDLKDIDIDISFCQASPTTYLLQLIAFPLNSDGVFCEMFRNSEIANKKYGSAWKKIAAIIKEC